MRRPLPICTIWAIAAMLADTGCGDEPNGSGPAAPASSAAPASAVVTEVGYDLRRLRPRNEEPLEAMFERMRAQAVAEGKVAAILFSADWCEPCRRLELELGNLHEAGEIGHVRIFELKEEEWEAVTRMNEFNALRRRWYAPVDSYPVLILLDHQGEKIEEMKEAIARLEQEGVDPTLPNWFKAVRPHVAG